MAELFQYAINNVPSELRNAFLAFAVSLRDRVLFDAAFDSVVKPKLGGAKVIPLKGQA